MVVWPVVAVTTGVVPSVVLLMPLGVGSFDATGLALGGAAAALLALFVLVLLPLVELLLPPLRQRMGRRRAMLVPVTGVVLVLALTAAGLAADRTDPRHPRRTDLVYLLDADTGRARWVSRDAAPPEWTRRYVTARCADPECAEPVGLADGPVWVGPAPAVGAPAPQLSLRSRQGGARTLHVFSPRSAPSVVLRVGHRVEEVTVTAPGLAPAAVTVQGTLPGRWPTEVRFDDLPAEGVDITLRVPDPGTLRIAAHDQTAGLVSVPGFLPRPPDLQRPPRRDSDAILVARTYQF